MKRAFFVLAVLLSEPLRLVVFSRMGLTTDWLLALTVLAALGTKPPRGVAIGFILGAGRDLMYGQPIGFETLLFCAAAWLIGGTGGSVYGDAFTTQALMVFATLVLHGAALYVRVMGSMEGVFTYLWSSVFAGALIPAIGIPLGAYAVSALMKPKLSEDLQILLKEAQTGRFRKPRF